MGRKVAIAVEEAELSSNLELGGKRFRWRETAILAVLASVIVIALVDFARVAMLPQGKLGQTDFTDLYVGGWLWRHGENPYESGRVRETWNEVSGRAFSSELKTIYPPTAYMLTSPLTLLPWPLANTVFAWMQFAGIFCIPWLLLCGSLQEIDKVAVVSLTAGVVAYSPFHTAMHLNNASAICIATIVAALTLVERWPGFAGVLLGMTCCVKPQVGLWFVVLFLIARQKRAFWWAMGTGAILVAAALAPYATRLPELRQGYREEMKEAFGPGKTGDYTDRTQAARFSFVNVQPLVFQIVQSRTVANGIAWGAFGVLFAGWVWVARKTGARDFWLTASALIAVSDVALYRRSYDLGLFVIPLCWAAANYAGPLKKYAIAIGAIGATAFLPITSMLYRLSFRVPQSLQESLGWRMVVEPMHSWIVLAMAVATMAALGASRKGERWRAWEESV
ncbi:MAG TPA: glycosyltransferase family 87 protein [Terriglobales bacterium]